MKKPELNVKIKNLASFVFSLVVCLAAGAVGSMFTAASVDGWYRQLNKPSFNPPSWIFAPVWTFLYILMGVSLFLVWSAARKPGPGKNLALSMFFLQLFLNVLWSVLFFGMENPLLAFAGILLLLAAIVATFVMFRKISLPAAYLLIPYILWVAFASVLNYYIVILN